MVEERVWSLGGEVLSEASNEKGQVSVKTKLAFSSGSLEEAMIGAAGTRKPATIAVSKIFRREQDILSEKDILSLATHADLTLTCLRHQDVQQ